MTSDDLHLLCVQSAFFLPNARELLPEKIQPSCLVEVVVIKQLFSQWYGLRPSQNGSLICKYSQNMSLYYCYYTDINQVILSSASFFQNESRVGLWGATSHLGLILGLVWHRGDNLSTFKKVLLTTSWLALSSVHSSQCGIRWWIIHFRSTSLLLCTPFHSLQLGGRVIVPVCLSMTQPQNINTLWLAGQSGLCNVANVYIYLVL